MNIYASMIGVDFKPSNDPVVDAEGTQKIYITENDELYLKHKQHYDQRTGFLNTYFSPAGSEFILSSVQWYVDYMFLNYRMLDTFMADNPGKQLPVMNMLNIGYIPIGYPPSFLSELNPIIVRVLEICKVPYVLYRATVMGKTYYKTDTKDVWVSKIDAAKYLGCAPEDVTFVKLLGGLLHGIQSKVN